MEIELYKPGDPVLLGHVLSLDTETEPIVGRHAVPDVVTLQVYNGGDVVHVVMWPDIPRYLHELDTWNPKSHFVFHNCAFDIPVLGTPDFFIRAVDEGRVHDTMLKYALFCLSEIGNLDRPLSLKAACKTVLDITVAKEADVRLSFTRAQGDLSREQIEYAALDAVYTYWLFEAIPADKAVTEDIQVKAALALGDISRRGFLVDEARRQATETRFTELIAKALIVMSDNGYVPGMKGNKKVLHKLVQEYADIYGIDLPRTEKTGAISTSAATMDLFKVEEIPFLKAFKEQEYFNKINKNWLDKENVGPDGRIHTRFTTIMVTGRTSSSNPNLQNLPREGNIRGIFIPPEGKLLASVDYCQLELCSLAQQCLCKYGHSTLAEYINSGRDVHKYLASLNYGVKEEDVDWKSPLGKKMRQSAKISNFGKGMLDF